MADRIVEVTDRFLKDYKRLDLQTQQAVDSVLKGLQSSPFPRALRHHTLSGHRPKIHVADVHSNHSYQVTFYWQGELIRLLRVGTHAQINRSPD